MKETRTTVGTTTIVAYEFEDVYESGLLVKYESAIAPNSYLILAPTKNQAFEIWKAYTGKDETPVWESTHWSIEERDSYIAILYEDCIPENTTVNGMAYIIAVVMYLVGEEACAAIVAALDESWG